MKPQTIFFEIETLYTQNGDIILCDELNHIVINSDNLFMWLDSINKNTIEQREHQTKNTIEKLGKTLKELNK